MKKVYVFILSLFVTLLSVCVPVCAKEADTNLPRVVDNANLLTVEEESNLEKSIAKISKEYEFDIVILTLPNLYYSDGYGGGTYKSPEAYADDYFDYKGYGYGKKGQRTDRDGIIFLVSMQSRDYHFGTCGTGLDIISQDYGLVEFEDRIVPDLSNGEYYDAFKEYVSLTKIFLEQAEKGRPYSSIHRYRTGPETVLAIIGRIVLSLIVGLIVALIYVSSLKSKMSTVNKKYQAKEYVENNNVNVTFKDDRFLRSSISKTSRQSSSSSSGGSSSHRSSSGSRHGGRSGKF